MNSTTTCFSVPKASTVLFVGALWMAAIAAILVINLAGATSAGEFASRLLIAAGAAIASVIFARAAVSIGSAEIGEGDIEHVPCSRRPALEAGKVKAA